MHEKVVKYESGLPVGVNAETGELASFEEARTNPHILKETMKSTPQERQALAQSRIEKSHNWPEREFHPGGFIDRKRALQELHDGGALAAGLIETEVRVADWVARRLREEANHG